VKREAGNSNIQLMEEILNRLIVGLSHYLQGFYTAQVVQDLSRQQYFKLPTPPRLMLRCEVSSGDRQRFGLVLPGMVCLGKAARMWTCMTSMN